MLHPTFILCAVAAITFVEGRDVNQNNGYKNEPIRNQGYTLVPSPHKLTRRSVGNEAGYKEWNPAQFPEPSNGMQHPFFPNMETPPSFSPMMGQYYGQLNMMPNGGYDHMQNPDLWVGAAPQQNGGGPPQLPIGEKLIEACEQVGTIYGGGPGGVPSAIITAAQHSSIFSELLSNPQGPFGGMTGPSGGMNGPSGGMNGPSGGMNGPSGGMNGPSGGMLGPFGGISNTYPGFSQSQIQGGFQNLASPNGGMPNGAAPSQGALSAAGPYSGGKQFEGRQMYGGPQSPNNNFGPMPKQTPMKVDKPTETGDMPICTDCGKKEKQIQGKPGCAERKKPKIAKPRRKTTTPMGTSANIPQQNSTSRVGGIEIAKTIAPPTSGRRTMSMSRSQSANKDVKKTKQEKQPKQHRCNDSNGLPPKENNPKRTNGATISYGKDQGQAYSPGFGGVGKPYPGIINYGQGLGNPYGLGMGQQYGSNTGLPPGMSSGYEIGKPKGPPGSNNGLGMGQQYGNSRPAGTYQQGQGISYGSGVGQEYPSSHPQGYYPRPGYGYGMDQGRPFGNNQGQEYGSNQPPGYSQGMGSNYGYGMGQVLGSYPGAMPGQMAYDQGYESPNGFGNRPNQMPGNSQANSNGYWVGKGQGPGMNPGLQPYQSPAKGGNYSFGMDQDFKKIGDNTGFRPNQQLLMNLGYGSGQGFGNKMATNNPSLWNSFRAGSKKKYSNSNEKSKSPYFSKGKKNMKELGKGRKHRNGTNKLQH